MLTILILNILPLFLEEFFNHSFIHDDAPSQLGTQAIHQNCYISILWNITSFFSTTLIGHLTSN